MCFSFSTPRRRHTHTHAHTHKDSHVFVSCSGLFRKICCFPSISPLSIISVFGLFSTLLRPPPRSYSRTPPCCWSAVHHHHLLFSSTDTRVAQLKVWSFWTPLERVLRDLNARARENKRWTSHSLTLGWRTLTARSSGRGLWDRNFSEPRRRALTSYSWWFLTNCRAAAEKSSIFQKRCWQPRLSMVTSGRAAPWPKGAHRLPKIIIISRGWRAAPEENDKTLDRWWWRREGPL